MNELEKEIKRLKDCVFDLMGETYRLRNGLEIFGSHQEWCEVNHKKGIKCNCGYEEAIYRSEL